MTGTSIKAIKGKILIDGNGGPNHLVGRKARQVRQSANQTTVPLERVLADFVAKVVDGFRTPRFRRSATIRCEDGR
jgi:hypothetical protein